MKFIGGLQKTKFDKDKLIINLARVHRASTGSITNSKLYTYPVFTKDDDGNEFKEIIISQFAPKNWNNIFRLKFWIKDEPGITKKIFEFLAKNKINIYTQESIMTRYNLYFTISIVADVTKFIEKYENTRIENNEKISFSNLYSKKEKLQSLLRELFNEDSDLSKYKSKPLTLKPLVLLNNHSGIYKDVGRINDIPNQTLDKYRNSDTYKSLNINCGKIELGEKIIEEYIGVNINEDVYYTVNSDTDEKYILVRFFEKQLIIQLDIEHFSGEFGVLDELSEEVSKFSDYNIISSYDRIQDHNKTSHWIVMLDCSKSPEKIIELIKNLKNKTGKRVQIIRLTENFKKIKEIKDDLKQYYINEEEQIHCDTKKIQDIELEASFVFNNSMNNIISSTKANTIFSILFFIFMLTSIVYLIFSKSVLDEYNYKVLFVLIVLTVIILIFKYIIFKLLKIDNVFNFYVSIFNKSSKEQLIKKLNKKYTAEFKKKKNAQQKI